MKQTIATWELPTKPMNEIPESVPKSYPVHTVACVNSTAINRETFSSKSLLFRKFIHLFRSLNFLKIYLYPKSGKKVQFLPVVFPRKRCLKYIF